MLACQQSREGGRRVEVGPRTTYLLLTWSMVRSCPLNPLHDTDSKAACQSHGGSACDEECKQDTARWEGLSNAIHTSVGIGSLPL